MGPQRVRHEQNNTHVSPTDTKVVNTPSAPESPLAAPSSHEPTPIAALPCPGVVEPWVFRVCISGAAQCTCPESGFSRPTPCERHVFLCVIGHTLLHFHCRWVFCDFRAHVCTSVLRTGAAKGMPSENRIFRQHCASPPRKKERSCLVFDSHHLLGAQRGLLVISLCIFLPIRSFPTSRICFW